MWFIGMEFRKMENLNVDLTENIQNFTNLVHKHTTNIGFHKPGMDFEVPHVRWKQLNTYLDKDILNIERKKSGQKHAATETTMEPSTTQTQTETETETEPHQNESPAKRQKVNENTQK